MNSIKIQRWIGDKFLKQEYSIPSGATDVLALPVEFQSNPVLDPATDRAYYPSLLYFPSGFDIGGTPYKYVCVHSLDTDSGGGIIIAGSNDFETWTELNSGNPLTGLPSSAHHPHVVQLGDSSFRIYYWDTSLLYTVSAMRTAVSSDLLTWTDDQPLQNGANPIVTGVHPDWNRGTYGPCQCFYNAEATNEGDNPFDYSFALFFDGTTGGQESMGLGYSADGITFNLKAEVLPCSGSGSTAAWDANFASYGEMFQTPLGKWVMFYSGGISAVNEGIGIAVSDNRINWTKMTATRPLITVNAGTWRDNRAYACSLVTDFTDRFTGNGEEADLKMLVSGKSAGGDYTLGYFKIPYIYADVKEALYRMELL